MLRQELWSSAAAVLRKNDRGPYTVPSGRLYPHQWAWDSAFAAIGWGHLDLERAAREIDSLLAGQWPDGRIPHIQFHHLSVDYFPGPASWGAERTSTISNPPVWTIAIRRLLELGLPAHRVVPWLEACDRSHRFFHQHRDPLQWNLICSGHPWENGQDNCPGWDQALQAVDPQSAPEFQRVDKERVADPAERPSDEQYRRYMSLVAQIASNGFGLGQFAVYDPFMTTMVIRAEEDLDWMAGQLGYVCGAGERAARLREGLSRLWDPESARYLYYDAIAKRSSAPETLSSLSPVLLGPEVPGYRRCMDQLKTCYQTRWPLPTVLPGSRYYDPRCYWRGPSWVNMNWLFVPVLGPSLSRRTLDLLERQGFWEYFEPHSGRGLGTSDFTWSAALALDLMAS
jgi:hypothetical protein